MGLWKLRSCPVETERQGWRGANEGSSEKVLSLVSTGAAKEMSRRKRKGKGVMSMGSSVSTGLGKPSG